MTWIEMAAPRRPSMAPPGVVPPENAADWYRIENNADASDTTDVFVYDSIGGWFGMYADDFIRDLKAVSTPKINLRINSPGGSVFDGVAIANAIRMHPANVTVYVDGLAASIASVIALAGDRLVMMPTTSFMIHDASGGCHGNAAEMEYMRDLLDKQSNNIAAAYAAAAGGTPEEWRAKMRAETWYTAEEAVTAGLADEVMPLLPKKEAEPATEAAAELPVYARMQATWDLSMYRYAGRDAAPEPPVAKKSEQPHLVVNVGDRIDAQLVEMLRKSVRSEAPDPAPEPAPAPVIGDELIEAIRAVVKAEIEAALPAPEPEDEAEPPAEPEAPVEPDATADTPLAEPATGTSTDETGPADESATALDETDDWDSLVAHLTTSASLSADDVFNSLKEAW